MLLGTASGRRVLLATVLASAMVLLDATAVDVARPAVGTDLDASLAGLQWSVTGYTLALAALVLLGGTASVVRERRAARPMLPLSVFAERRFTGADLATLAVHAALGGSSFLVLRLQTVLGYGATAAGASMLPPRRRWGCSTPGSGPCPSGSGPGGR